MKKFHLFLIALSLLGLFNVNAQVQIDHQLQMTGSGSDAEITGIKNINNVTGNQDAVSVDYLQRDSLKFAMTTGSNNAYLVALSPPVTTQYTVGMIVHFIANFANTGAATLAVNSLPSATIKKNYNADLASGDIQNGQAVSVMYDGTHFQMLTQLGNSGAQATTYTIGLDTALGGYVFYVTPNGQHGLVVETQDQGTDTWYNGNNGDVRNLISNPASHSTAGKNFTDRRLPTLDELNEMYVARSAIGGFSAGNYWTYTETFGDGSAVWTVSFANGTTGQYNKDTNAYNVRAVRDF